MQQQRSNKRPPSFKLKLKRSCARVHVRVHVRVSRPRVSLRCRATREVVAKAFKCAHTCAHGTCSLTRTHNRVWLS